MIEVISQTLGWKTDIRSEALFRWKHYESPFGPSLMWVAVDRGQVVALRAFLRWEFTSGQGTVRAVRAVDTAVHPDYQGLGIFTRLTLHAIEQMSHKDVAFVFNTPNEQSRPGYLKMGWEVVGRLPLRVRPRGVLGLARAARARTSADLWSLATEAGNSATEVLAQLRDEDLLHLQAPANGLRTPLTAPYLRWRYGNRLFGYRLFLTGDDVSAGVAILRLRQRGAAREAVLCDVFLPPGGGVDLRAFLAAVVRSTDADYAIRMACSPAHDGFIPLPGQGPTLWRSINQTRMPPLREWRLGLGEIELF
jgi:GNAT superfamily N-acetyltransferase